MKPKNILAICGSTRATSSNMLLLKFITSYYSKQLNVTVFENLASLPHFNPDSEEAGEVVNHFRSLIEAADGVLICTPEYVFSVPAILKNALEWTVSTTIFSGKATAFIVASGLGEKSFESLHLILKTLGCVIGEHAALLLQGARAKFTSEGNLIDQKSKQAIDVLINSFLENIETRTSTKETF